MHSGDNAGIRGGKAARWLHSRMGLASAGRSARSWLCWCRRQTVRRARSEVRQLPVRPGGLGRGGARAPQPLSGGAAHGRAVLGRAGCRPFPAPGGGARRGAGGRSRPDVGERGLRAGSARLRSSVPRNRDPAEKALAQQSPFPVDSTGAIGCPSGDPMADLTAHFDGPGLFRNEGGNANLGPHLRVPDRAPSHLGAHIGCREPEVSSPCWNRRVRLRRW